jgi:uncharacterized Zn finger protein
MRRRGRSRYGYNQWPKYVPVAERRAQAARKTATLQKQGKNIHPVEIEGRTIARSFWGKGWCTHLESFGDYSNRLPRGRTYVRNGSVCHLGIGKGSVTALVSGSNLYNVKVDIQPLEKTAWDTIRTHCVGKIGSLIELLQGQLSDEIMQTVTDRQHGLFPKPGEISYTCDCPDWAHMCKHVAAVMYGIGARLDKNPELLFLLRGVDHQDLLSAEAAVGAITGDGARRTRRRQLSTDDLSSVFGVELDAASETDVEQSAAKKNSKPNPRTGSKKKGKQPPAFKPTGRTIQNLRAQSGLNKTEFARTIGVSPATISNWEKTKGAVTPHAKNLAGLQRLYASHRQ